jgi:hypothetical protein
VQHPGGRGLLLWEDDVSDGRMTDAGRADAISRFRSMVYGAERRGDLQSAGFYAVVANELEAQQADLAALTATCAALSEEKAQEVERRLRAEAERDNALALKRTAYKVLDDAREVVEGTIIPALEYIGGGSGKPAADLKREALAAARKLLKD